MHMYFKIPNLLRIVLLSGLVGTSAYEVLPYFGITHGLLHAELIVVPACIAASLNNWAQLRHRRDGPHGRDQDGTG